MSTTFDIYPRNAEAPWFEHVCALATEHFRGGTIFAEIRAKEPDVVVVAHATGRMQWSDDHYAWFRVEGVNGGADAYFHGSVSS
ncbi:MAG TPA: hypothetical protein VM733_15805 [Thermoanaerobaculia bacterium]|nr:hypothetical protein [Thermoanaerobaculia bacterium]